MARFPYWMTACGLLFVMSFSGCGWMNQEDDLATDDSMSEFDDSDEQPETGAKLTSAKNNKSETLELRLKVGDRFPLMKTVEQRLKQISKTGGPAIESTSMLTLTLAIDVEEISDGLKKLGVRYLRVRYEHDIAGEKLRYDSAVPETMIPEAAQVYHGLVDNGFSFLLGADNRIVKVIDFDGFLKRCARHAPPAQQRELITKLVTTQEDEGIANFVDDSIGLLPYNIDSTHAGCMVKVGDFWRKSRQIMRPIPMTVDSKYSLTSLNDRYANIEVFGEITPSKLAHVADGVAQRVGLTDKMNLRNGHCFGNCTIDRETGLPIQSRVVRQMEMTLELPNGAKFDQQKSVTTTIRAFPQQGAAAANADPVEDSNPVANSRSASREQKVLPTGYTR